MAVSDKRCKRCGVVKMAEAFHCRNGRPVARCKSCVSEARRAAYAADPTVRSKIAEQGKSYRSRNSEAVRARKKLDHENNRERNNARSKANNHLYADARTRYRLENKQFCHDVTKRWIAQNRDRYNASIREYMRSRRAKMTDGATRAEVRAWERQQPKVCRWCANPCADNYHVDHMNPIARGGSHKIANLAISCPPCNQAKAAMPLAKWLDVLAAKGMR